MRIIGCDLHSRQQTLSMLDAETGEVEEHVLGHEGEEVREFYSGLPGPVRVGIEASCATQWFLQLMEELGVECWVGHPAKIRAYEPRKQKNDLRDARLLRGLLTHDIFPPDLGTVGRTARRTSAAHASTSMGTVCACGFRTHCNRSRSVMDCAEGRGCGARTDNFRFWHCRCPSTPKHVATS